jgi:hypothetical protein
MVRITIFTNLRIFVDASSACDISLMRAPNSTKINIFKDVRQGHVQLIFFKFDVSAHGAM